MQGVWLEAQKLTVRDDLPAPKPTPDEALIDVSYAGICGTDLQLLSGYYPYAGVPGHEFIGRVVAADKHPLWIGKRVVGEINVACGQCTLCRNNLSNHCAQRKVLGIRALHGAFATQLVLPVSNLYEVPDCVTDECAVFTEPVAAALQILEQVSIRAEHKVMIIGAGKLGQIIAQVLNTTGCDLYVVTRYAEQRALLSDPNITCMSEREVVSHCMDVVIEASGSPSGFALASTSVVPRGTIVLKSTFAARPENCVDLSTLVVNEVTLVGSRCGPFATALDFLSQHKIDPTRLIQSCYPLRDALDAFTEAKTSNSMKILLQP